MKRSHIVAAAALALLLLLANLVVSAPARLLLLVLPSDRVLVSGVSGTLWDGRAGSVMLLLPQGYFQLGTVEWSLQPRSLLKLAPRLSLRTDWGSQRLSGDIVLRDRQDLDLLDLDISLDAALIGQFAPVVADGLLSLQLQKLRLRDGLPYSTEGRLVWQDSGWNSPRGLVPLGTYALELRQAPGDPLRGEIVTVSGPLRASGSVSLVERRYDVDVLLEGERDLDAATRQMLSLMAAPEGAGFRIRIGGDF